MEDGDYPLGPLRDVRDHELAAREIELREELAVLAEAEESLDRARTTLREHRLETRALEHRPLDAGERPAGDLVRGEVFLARRREEARLLNQRFFEARCAAEQAALATEKARVALARAHAAQQALEKHRARWESQVAKTLESREEHETADSLAGRRALEST